MDDPNEMSREHLDSFSIQLARVILAAGHFDEALAKVVTELLDLNPLQEAVLVRPIQPRAKIDMLARLAKQFLDASGHKLFAAYANAAKDTLDERNAVVHGIAGHFRGKVAIRSYTGQYRLTGTPQRWSVTRASDLADAIIGHENRLRDAVAPLATHKEALRNFRQEDWEPQGEATAPPE